MLPEYMLKYPRRAGGKLLPLDSGYRIQIYRKQVESLDHKGLDVVPSELCSIPEERTDDKPSKRAGWNPGRGYLVLSHSEFHRRLDTIISVPCTSYKPEDRARKDKIPLLHRYPELEYGVHYAELNAYPVDHKVVVDYRYTNPTGRSELDRLERHALQRDILPRINDAYELTQRTGPRRAFRPFPQGMVVQVSFGTEAWARGANCTVIENNPSRC